MARLADRPDTTLDVYRGRKTTMQQQQIILQERLNDPRPARVVGTARALWTGRPGPAEGEGGGEATEKRVKITAGWGGSRTPTLYNTPRLIRSSEASNPRHLY